ncbi:tRNA 1-methyladenosine methyltransferase subunit GCD14 [Ascoidea rubescens DSM 1968]|uniref:tRNA (adenine(58)-N(1))-methyltransferase catalytic subunit TRM61 n=1 Tax=Ascoidea rubescens DSM 1968 TaxID=1344418 RepID=A0A1D2VJX8_9ASCO|nr:tRNA methyltransferase complex GCD14 subunit [Ascoidea rubescens DSM 1968]ODV61903.1 tRNA methyltransferase complex GCD14 subunit [Ascoidea rubescens DSM 1968]
MSFNEYKEYIEEGDLVLAWLSRDNFKPIYIGANDNLNTRYGSFPHSLMIGQRYGSQISSKSGKGFVYLLAPTPELWTLSLPHRTQIVYTPDSSYIIQRLNISSNSRIIEAGTGSGSFSHAFARSVVNDERNNGLVFSYEFHQTRYEKARIEFESHKLLNNKIILTHRDVCKNGFQVNNFPENKNINNAINGDRNGNTQMNVTVIFLDLPSPWDAIPHLDKVITQEHEARICCFSPCIEQVERTIRALSSNRWVQIEMVEVQSKSWKSHKMMIKDIDDVVNRLKDIKRRKINGIQELKEKNARRKRNSSDLEELQPNSEEGKEAPKQENKKARGFNPFGRGLRVLEGDENYNWLNITRMEPEIKSHTSYLTFACKVPENKSK